MISPCLDGAQVRALTQETPLKMIRRPPGAAQRTSPYGFSGVATAFLYCGVHPDQARDAALRPWRNQPHGPVRTPRDGGLMATYERPPRAGLPVGHLSPALDGPACGAAGKVRLHRPGITRMCGECACVLEEPSSGAIITKEVRMREYLDAWVAWATGNGGPYPSYRDYLPSKAKPGDAGRRLAHPLTNTTANGTVAFKRS